MKVSASRNSYRILTRIFHLKDIKISKIRFHNLGNNIRWKGVLGLLLTCAISADYPRSGHSVEQD